MSRDPDADLDFDELAGLAADGDRAALTELVRGLQHPMYRLALRFLGHPQDAEDATPGDPHPDRHSPRQFRRPLEVHDLGLHRGDP
jgi:hypothetical protein